LEAEAPVEAAALATVLATVLAVLVVLTTLFLLPGGLPRRFGTTTSSAFVFRALLLFLSTLIVPSVQVIFQN
jgi:hypothetical protein